MGDRIPGHALQRDNGKERRSVKQGNGTIKLGLKMPSWGDCVQNGLEDTGVNAGESVRMLLP